MFFDKVNTENKEDRAPSVLQYTEHCLSKYKLPQ